MHGIYAGPSTVIIFICVGVYSLTYSFTDVVLVLGFGLLGYGLKLAGYEPAPLLIGFILGPLIEEYLRRAMLLARGDFLTILQRMPIFAPPCF
ncbi:tripartite tricarboxylate transporter permease [Devosia enhydra]|uniref:tripartite tricarboxylate transporter permease n=1 Tax=Devosia enhydra TaxID=665118 RepID=UPI000931952B|nr:tripartite tricarboxylate transporter permease [Devosia enhydra]